MTLADPRTDSPRLEAPTASIPHTLSAMCGPADLRRLGPADLRRLAVEIRSYLIDVLSETGGHLGPNLGVVELTMALHRVFRSPQDAILWDTGHQAYVHKLLTGRAASFSTIRQPGGVSGYPNRAESPHDHIENSHASTALSYAFGMAYASSDRRVVAVVGDGALTGGLAYEGLSTIGHAGLDVVVVLNDNGRSYAPTVSRLTTAPDGPCRAPGSEPPASDPEKFAESLGFTYLGPVDGHDLGATEEALEVAAALRRPVLVHVHTRKGEGYQPCRSDEEKRLHDVSPFDPAHGPATGSAHAPSSFTGAFARAILHEAERHPELVAITAAMPGPTGLLEMARRFPDRFVDVGIAEQHAVVAAAGMAMAGRRPVVAVYSTFLNRAWDQVVHDVALHRLPVVFCLDRAGVTGDDGPSHHGVLDLVLMTKVPGMTVLVPSSADEVPGMLALALSITEGPVAIRWPKTASRPPLAGAVELGLRARKVRTGPDVCLLGVGKLAHACDDAAGLLARHGVRASVWDVRVARPLDAAMLEDASRHPLVVTAEDGFVEGGVGASVAAQLAPVAVETCGLPMRFIEHGRPDQILAAHGLDGSGIAARTLSALGLRSAATA